VFSGGFEPPTTTSGSLHKAIRSESCTLGGLHRYESLRTIY
jgi:hypothetical protein